MKTCSIWKIRFGLFLFCLLGTIRAVAQDSTVWRVGIHPDPPFIIKTEGGEYRGLCIDLWEGIAAELQLEFEYKEFNDLIGMIRELDYNEIDISINPINVSSTRLRMFEVSQPFFISSIGVASTSVSRNQFQIFIKNFFSLDFLKIILLLFFVIFCFGTILWIVERKNNQNQFRPGIMGLLDGLWWSAVTMTTVGYGDKAPKTTLGKGIAIVWMFTAVIIISGFTATIASTLTVNSLASQIESMEDMKAIKKIGTVTASSSEEFLISHQILPKATYDSPQLALRGLSQNEVDIVVFDKAVIRYLINTNQVGAKVQLLPITFNKQYRSFLMPKSSALFPLVNPILVKRINQASWQEVLHRYNLEEEK